MISFSARRQAASGSIVAFDTVSGTADGELLTGTAGDDTLYGYGGDDTLDGGAGADWMAGGTGNDLYRVDDAGDRAVEGSAGGVDLVEASVAFTLGNGVENLRLVGTAAIDATGNGLGNSLTGNAGANLLDGRAGDDTMAGLSGDDVYVVDRSGDVVVETPGAGYDVVRASADFVLPDDVEELRFLNPPGGGTARYTGSGNAGDNVLRGAAGDDALYGLDGDDTLFGGGGDDTLVGGPGNDSLVGGLDDDLYVFEAGSSPDVIVEKADAGTDRVESWVGYTLADNVERLFLQGSDDIDGSGNAADNYVVGNAGNNVLWGGGGNDNVEGGGGQDTLLGSEGDDTYFIGFGDDLLTGTVDVVSGEAASVPPAGDRAPALGTGTDIDTVIAQIDYTLTSNVEILLQQGTADLSGTGNELANTITGNDGNNTLNGLAGNDTIAGGPGNDTLDGGGGDDSLAGGAGNDTYRVNSAADRVVEAAGAGSADAVISAVSWTLGGNVEHLTLSGAAGVAGTGNANGNLLTGNAAGNLLRGLAGMDTLQGRDGADTLSGGLGRDTLAGGKGADRFLFDAALSSSNVGASADLVTDFLPGTDRIALDRAVFTGFAGATLATGEFRTGAGLDAAQDADDRLLYDTGSGALYYDPDGTGAAAAVRIAVLGVDAHPGITAADIVLAG